MTASDNARHRRRPGVLGRLARQRWVPVVATATAAVLTLTAIATAGGGSAGAATAPNAQSAGNFLDATIGGKPIDQVLQLAYARAQNPGTVTDQNPLDVKALNAIDLPLTGALQLPQIAGITLGAVNQVALAKSDGASYGASGALLNSGGVSVGGNNSAPPANASVDLCPSAFSGGTCGTSPTDALGEVKLAVNGVSSIARTPQYGPALAGGWPSVCTQQSPTCYDIASVDLGLASPLIGSLLGKLTDPLTTILNQILQQLGSALPAQCKLIPTSPLTLDGGFVVLDPTNGSLTIDLGMLLKTLNLDLNELPANTDLLAKLLNYLTSPSGLAAGLTAVVNGLLNPLETQYQACKAALPAPIAQLLDTLIATQGGLQALIKKVTDAIANAGGPNPLAPIASALSKLLDIGVNVQPQLSSGDFKTSLDTDPKQGMTPPPPVPYQHTVRAIEVKLLGTVTLALANSAAGPSHPAAPPTSSAPPSHTVPPTTVPTGVPAGAGTHGGSPALPITLLLLGLMFGAGGVVAFRMRGRLNAH